MSDRTRCLLAVCVTSLALGACSGGREAGAPPREKASPPLLYVAIGGSESEGHGARDRLRGAWPQRLFRESLPSSTTFVNLARDAEDNEDIFGQVDVALTLEPALVTIESDDLALHGVDPLTYEAALSDAVRRLRRAGTETVVLATVRPLDRLPGYLACLEMGSADPACRVPSPIEPPGVVTARVDMINAAIRAVAERDGAVVADVHAAFVRAIGHSREARLTADNGVALSPAGHQLVARAVARIVHPLVARSAGGDPSSP